MTRKSKRELKRALDDMQDGDAMMLDWGDMWDWIEALQNRGTDVSRPPAYFADGAEWTDGLQEWKATATERYPELAHLSPPEVYVFCYLDNETSDTLLQLLATSSDDAVEEWREAVKPAGSGGDAADDA